MQAKHLITSGDGLHIYAFGNMSTAQRIALVKSIDFALTRSQHRGGNLLEPNDIF